MKFKMTASIIGTFIMAFTFLPGLNAQNSPLINNGTMESYISMGDVQMIQTMDLRYEGVKGTPFLYEDWAEGYVVFIGREDEKQKTFKLNINMMDNQLFVALYDGTVGPLPSKFVKEIFFNGPEETKEHFIPMPRKQIEDLNTNESAYYQVIYQGDVLLLKHHRKSFKEADFKGAYSSDIRYDEYKDDNRYFLSLDGKTFNKVKLKSKDLEKALPDHTQEIKSISKKEKLNLSKEEDVKKLLSLLENQ